MRFRTLLSIFLAGTALAAAGPRIAPEDAERYRAQLVTLAGVVSEVQSRADGVVLRVGSHPGVPVLVPQSARARFRTDPMTWHEKAVEVTGFLTPPGRPLAMVVQHPEDIRPDTSEPPTGSDCVRQRVVELESELDRLRQRYPVENDVGGVTVGPVPAEPQRRLGLYATQATVLAEHGVPTRVDWSNGRRTLRYGTEVWSFDEDGQLIDVREE
jgi:hypothetical protein